MTTEMPVLAVKRGDTLRLLFTYRVLGTGEVFDLSGCSARLQVRRSRGDSAGPVQIAASTADGTLVIDEVAGTIELTVSGAQMAAMKPGDYLADIELTYADGTVESSSTFILRVAEDVTYG